MDYTIIITTAIVLIITTMELRFYGLIRVGPGSNNRKFGQANVWITQKFG